MATSAAGDTDPVTEMNIRLLTAAEACFNRYGIAKTTMDDVAREGGVSRATVYRYFPDREALVAASIVRRARLNIPDAHAHMAKYRSFARKLVEGLIFNIRRGQHDPVVTLIVGGQSELAAKILGGTEVAHELTYELWEPILAAAQERGEMSPDLDLRAAATWLARVTLMLVAQEESERLDGDALRAELRTFVLPAFTALTARESAA